MEFLNLTNVVISGLLAVTVYFLTDAFKTLRDVQQEHNKHAIRLENHEVRIVNLEDSQP